ncbi:MAG: hypothetical protein IKK82_08215 [Kiritimatiellae bacterium]|nr:hypothetical protein [Kiritimatiellia bacterium]
MNTSRRTFLARMAARSLPLFNIGCVGFGQGRKAQLAKGAKTDSDAAQDVVDSQARTRRS